MSWRAVMLVMGLAVTLGAGIGGCYIYDTPADIKHPEQWVGEALEGSSKYQQNDIFTHESIISELRRKNKTVDWVRRKDGTWIGVMHKNGELICCFKDSQIDERIKKDGGSVDTSRRGENFVTLVEEIQAQYK